MGMNILVAYLHEGHDFDNQLGALKNSWLCDILFRHSR